jgi:protein-S-isoprenylcysteine O-methyltransferase Ste14
MPGHRLSLVEAGRFTGDCDGNVEASPGHPAAARHGTVVIPGVILWLTGPDTLGLWHSAPAARVGLPVLGGALVCLGLVLMVATIRLFMTVGKGTLAPWNPPQRLVVRGVYRYVRNPMISGACCLLLGEAVLAASLPLLGLFTLAVIVNAVYIPLSEEPGLVKRFGDDYLAYKRNVPRWIPRLTPWPTDPPGNDTKTS